MKIILVEKAYDGKTFTSAYLADNDGITHALDNKITYAIVRCLAENKSNVLPIEVRRKEIK